MILASQSPRRKELLSRITTDFKTIPADIDESRLENENPKDYVLRLGKEKAKKISQQYPTELVIASDTTVALGNEIMGKPKDKKDAYEMLKKFSGKTHQVNTSLCLLQGSKEESLVSTCEVTFYPLTEKEINDYLKKDEYKDKAGSYAIQGDAGLFVEKINGDYYTVMGLPLAQLNQILKKF